MQQAKEVEGKLEEVVGIKKELEEMIKEKIKKNMEEHREENLSNIAEIITRELKTQEERREKRDEEILKLLRETKADNYQMKTRMITMSEEIKRDRDERVKLEKKVNDNVVKNEVRMGKLEEEIIKMRGEMKRIGNINGNGRVTNLEKELAKVEEETRKREQELANLEEKVNERKENRGNGIREEEILKRVQEQVDGRFEWEKDNERRKPNLVIFNLEESGDRDAEKRIEHDRKVCEELYEEGLGI